MAQDTTEIRVGASGSVYIGATTDTLPTDIDTAIDAAFIDLGYVSEDGVNLTPSMSVEKIMAWQKTKAVRVVKTEDELSVGFSLQQLNEVNLPLALGGGSIATDAGPPIAYTYTPPAAGTVDERALIVEWVDGSFTYRLVIPRGMVTDVGDIPLNKSSEIALELSFEVLGSDPDDFYIITDDTAFAA